MASRELAACRYAHTGSRQKVTGQEASASQLGRSKSHANCGSKSYQNVNPRLRPPPDAMMGSCPLGGFYFPLLPLPLPASPLFLHIFIHLACFASLLPDSFGPVQGTMGIRGEGEHPSYDENIYIYLLYDDYDYPIRRVSCNVHPDASGPTLAVRHPKGYHAVRVRRSAWRFVCSRMMMVVAVRTSGGGGNFSQRGWGRWRGGEGGQGSLVTNPVT